MSQIEIVNLPYMNNRFKIVELYINENKIEKPVMLCGSKQLGNQYNHQSILEKYLKDTKISYDTTVLNPKRPRRLSPALETPGKYKVVGMGIAGIDQFVRDIKLPWGCSAEYQIGIDEEFDMMLKEMFMKDSEYWNFLRGQYSKH